MPSKASRLFPAVRFCSFPPPLRRFKSSAEPMLAATARPRVAFSKDAVMIDSNENPLGPGPGRA